MKIKLLRSIANSLCQMGTSTRIKTSLEILADIPDGIVTINLVEGICNHSKAGVLELPMVKELHDWLIDQLNRNNISLDVLEGIEFKLTYTSDRVPSDRQRLVLFDLETAIRIEYEGRAVEASSSNSLWHERIEV